MPQAKDEAGNVWEVDAQGNPVRLLQAAGGTQGQVYELPADPVEQARIRNETARVDIARSADSRNAATQGLREDLLRAQIAKAQADAAKAAQGTAGAATGDAKLQARVANINALVEQINRVQELYESGPGATRGVAGLQDYLPNASNSQFNSASAGLAEQGMAAFRVPGVGAQSDTELRQFVEANRPSASDYDTSIEEKLRQLRLRVDSTRESMGLAPADWRGQVPSQEDDRQNALIAPRIIGGGGPGTAPTGSTTQGVPINPQYQAQYEAFVRKGGFTPESYAQFRQGLDRQFGYATSGDYAAEGERILGVLQNGGSLNLTIPPMEAPLEGADKFRNDLVGNPIGAATVNLLDAGGFGGVSALAGDRMDALQNDYPVSSAVGQIGGALTGTAALGKLAREGVKRALPARAAVKALRGGGSGGNFARNLATDAAYSGAYGGMSGQGAEESAALGAVGSAAGQGVGKALSTIVGGVALSPAVQTLRQRGIPLTVGQTLGGTAKAIEDAMTSIPFAGQMVSGRRLEGVRAFNEQAFNEAGAPIGARVGKIGEDGVASLIDQAGNAYDSATAGVTVPLDGPFYADLQQVAQRSRMLPDDLRARFSSAMDNRMAPIATGTDMTGEQYQQAFRGLKGYRAETTKPGFEQDYRDALTGAMDALTGAMERGGGDQVASGLRNADQAYRGAKTLQRAVTAARNGGRSGELQVFMPSQLNDAATQAATKYGGGRQFSNLIDNAQEVLPSQVPDSGTAGRLAVQGLVGAGALGGAGAVDYGTGGDLNALQKTALAIALLTAGGTRAGQRSLDALLARRPDAARKVGAAIGKRKGLFGSAAVPLVLEASQ